MIEIESNVTGNQGDIHVRLQELNAMISKALEEQ
jgi:hypothetical protein